MNTVVFPKALKITFAKHIGMIEYKGNLTKANIKSIAERLAKLMSEQLGKTFTVESCIYVLTHKGHTDSMKDVSITYEDNETISFRAKGWTATKTPKDATIISAL